MRVDLARVHHPVLAHKVKHRMRFLQSRCRPRHARCAGVHQRLRGARQKTVVDEEVFLNVELGVAPLQIAGAIALDAVAQCQVLSTCRGADRIRLHKAQPLDRPA